jgi:4-oxalocrotonate tautomerase
VLPVNLGSARRPLVASEETTIPIVTIQITREGATPAQKAALIKGATDLMNDVLNKDHKPTFVVIQEVELEDWGVGGLPVEEYRRRSAESPG